MLKPGFIKKEQKKEVPLIDVKFTHSLCIGQTGSGKTTSFIYPNLQNRMKLGHGILFFDIKGNEHRAVKKFAKEIDRLCDIIEIGKPWGRDINIIDNFNSRTFTLLLESIVGDPKEGGSNSYFYTSAIELGYILYSVLKTLQILSKELDELEGKIDSLLKNQLDHYNNFTLYDIYKITINMDSLYDFIQVIKEIYAATQKTIIENINLYKTNKQNILKNITLNNYQLDKKLYSLKKYDIEKFERNERDKFDPSLLSVLNTLHSGLSFMITPAAKYISAKTDAINIVQSLLDGKIVVINVRVIPDIILERLLAQIFEKLIDLNLDRKENRTPISIFIDEAQRLVEKDIPLDVLRSSKVDVVMAVQSELQFMAKFDKEIQWQQISANISDKVAFKSTPFNSDDSMNSFIIKNTALLKTFEYAYQYDSEVRLADPIFLDEDELNKTEYEYQRDVLGIQELGENEIFKYDVTHFESEREIILYNLDTKSKRYQKIFSKEQDEVIYKILEEYIPLTLEELIENNKHQVSLKKSSWKKLYDSGVVNDNNFKTKYYGSYDDWLEILREFVDLEYALLYEEISNNFDFGSLFSLKMEEISKETLETLKNTIIDNEQFIIFEENQKIVVFILDYNFEKYDYNQSDEIDDFFDEGEF